MTLFGFVGLVGMAVFLCGPTFGVCSLGDCDHCGALLFIFFIVCFCRCVYGCYCFRCHLCLLLVSVCESLCVQCRFLCLLFGCSAAVWIRCSLVGVSCVCSYFYCCEHVSVVVCLSRMLCVHLLCRSLQDALWQACGVAVCGRFEGPCQSVGRQR